MNGGMKVFCAVCTSGTGPFSKQAIGRNDSLVSVCRLCGGDDEEKEPPRPARSYQSLRWTRPDRSIDLRGKVFGRLIVIDRHGSSPNGYVTWNCECSCGNRHIAIGDCLRKGDTKSCGCLRSDVARSKIAAARDARGRAKRRAA